jgi:rRNA-processing protein FCF1
VTIVVDVANVMGSRPDGWWRDRARAAARLHAELARLAASGKPLVLDGAAQEGPEFVMVLEGAAKAAASQMARDEDPRVRVVQAAGSGDDAIVSVVRELGGGCFVVTADRRLRERCAAEGAKLLGPGWLLGLLR